MCWPVSSFQRAPQRFIRILTGCLHIASTERQSKSARTGIIHAIRFAAMGL
jgi:hypothetical protein